MLKLISLKLTVRTTFRALKLQISFARTHDKTQMNAITCTKSYSNSNASTDVGWNSSCHRVWILLHLYT